MDVAPLVFSDPSCHSKTAYNAGSDEELPPTPPSNRSPLLHLPTELLIDIAAILDAEYREDHSHGVDPLPVLRL